jgi:hypothetical protein
MPRGRIEGMRGALLASVFVAVVFSPAATPALELRVLRANGLAVVAPARWHLTHEELTTCSSPTQVMAVTDAKGGLRPGGKVPRERTLVLFLEDSGPKWFPRREPFRVQRLDRMGGCCDMPTSTGFELFFRDRGRNFYAFVYTAERANALKAVAMLNSLAVEPS